MRRLVTSAVLGMLGTALIVFSALAQDKALGVEGKTDFNRQGNKILGIVDGAGDTATVRLRLTSAGYVILDPSTTFPPTRTVSSGIEGVTIAAGGTASSQPDCPDLSAYSHVTALITWGTSALSDSSNISFGVDVFNKESASWGLNDARAFSPAFALSTTDSTFTIPTGQPAPSFYVYRTTVAPTGYQLAALARVPRYLAWPGGVAVNLDPYLGQSPNYVGMQIHNVHASVTMTGVKVVYLCRR